MQHGGIAFALMTEDKIFADNNMLCMIARNQIIADKVLGLGFGEGRMKMLEEDHFDTGFRKQSEIIRECINA